jgi:Protein of unknown function (DUF3574)
MCFDKLSTNGKPQIFNDRPFVLRLSKDERRVFPQPAREYVVHWNVFQDLLSVLLVLVSLMGCATMNGTPCRGKERLAVQDFLYFGTQTPSGRVTSEEWAKFLGETITPRFPEGLSAWQASGQWRSASGEMIREPSYVLSLVHSDSAIHDRAVQEIIASYKTRFQQEAVLRVRTTVCKTL